MGKYIVEASRKNGIFEPYDPGKHYIVSQEKLSEMLLKQWSWVVWSAQRIHSEPDAIDALKAQSIEFEFLE